MPDWNQNVTKMHVLVMHASLQSTHLKLKLPPDSSHDHTLIPAGWMKRIHEKCWNICHGFHFGTWAGALFSYTFSAPSVSLCGCANNRQMILTDRANIARDVVRTARSWGGGFTQIRILRCRIFSGIHPSYFLPEA